MKGEASKKSISHIVLVQLYYTSHVNRSNGLSCFGDEKRLDSKVDEARGKSRTTLVSNLFAFPNTKQQLGTSQGPLKIIIFRETTFSMKFGGKGVKTPSPLFSHSLKVCG